MEVSPGLLGGNCLKIGQFFGERDRIVRRNVHIIIAHNRCQAYPSILTAPVSLGTRIVAK